MRIDDWAYGNRWRQRHAAEKVLPGVLGLGAAVVSRSPWLPLAILLLMSGLILYGARVAWRDYLRLLLVPLAFLLLSVVTLAISFSGGELPLGQLPLLGWPLALTHAGLNQAGLALARSLGATSCLYFIALTTPMTELVALLRRLRVPALLLELMVLAYRQIFILQAAAGQIHRAQSARLGYVSTAASRRSLARLGGHLLLRSFEDARRQHQALLARGYGDELRTLGPSRSLSKPTLCLGSGSALVLLALAMTLPG